jgi:enoyl-CoA hydratase/carnithine racemase
MKREVTPEELDLANKYEALPGERRKLNYIPPSNFNKPIISVLQGNIRGGGLELALNSDIRLASEDATFGFPEVTRGIAAASGGMVLLPQIVGLGRAMELLLTGDAINAAEAYRIGLVNKIVAKEDLLNTAIKLAEKIASNAPLAVQATKETILRSIGISIAEGLSLSENQARNLLQTNDYKEGADAFIVKRVPKFIGR